MGKNEKQKKTGKNEIEGILRRRRMCDLCRTNHLQHNWKMQPRRKTHQTKNIQFSISFPFFFQIHNNRVSALCAL